MTAGGDIEFMTKIFFLLSILFLSLTISAQETENQSADIKTVDYCELRKNPDLYNGKTIRVSGIYDRGFEVSAFYNKACFENPYFSRHETWLWFFSRKKDCSDKKTAEIYETFLSGRAGNELEVTLVGMFNGSKEGGGFGHLGGYKFQLNVSCLEKAKLLPVEMYGCKRIDDTKPFHYISFVKTETEEPPGYEIESKNQKKEKLVWLRMNNNSTCSITVPTILSETGELKDQSEVPVVYKLSSSCVKQKDRLITKRKPTLSVLVPGNSIYFAVPLRFFTKEFFDVRVPFSFPTQKADFFYFFRSYLPEKLYTDLDCNNL